MKRWTNCLLLLMCLSLPGAVSQSFASETPFVRYDIKTTSDDIRLLLDGQIEYEFSREVLEALDNGLPLVILTEVQLLLPREWFWDEKIWSQSYEHSIEYHALSQQYLVKDLQADFQRAYLTRSSALEALGLLDKLPLLELDVLHPDKTYTVRLRSGLSSEALPVPLRPLTFLSENWQLRGPWISLSWHRQSPNG